MPSDAMKRKQIETFEKLNAQLEGFHQELSVLAKKSPNDTVNKFKLGFLNHVLSGANEFLPKQYRPFTDFNVFDEEELPTNSDVTFIIVQHLNCFEKLRADNIDVHLGHWYWFDGEESTEIRTGPPRKIQ